MRTVSRHRSSRSPFGDYQSQCHYCGVQYYRSELRRDGSGNLMCTPCDGIDASTLDWMNAAMTPSRMGLPPRDGKTETKVVEVATTLKAKLGGPGWTW